MKYVYKIVAALGALAAIPLTIFSKMFYFKFSSTAMELISYFLQMGNNETLNDFVQESGGKMPEAVADSFSIYDIYDLLSSISGFFEDSEATGKLDALITPVIVFLVIAAAVIICAVVTAILALVVKNNRKVIYSCIAGIGLSLMLRDAFDAIADPILNGTISVASLIDSVWGGLIGNIDKFLLNTNFWFIPVAFAGVILWTVLYNYTLPDDQKKERKLMLGEADEQ